MQTLQGYIFCILQHFVTKFFNFTDFNKFFTGIYFFLPKSKISLTCKLSINIYFQKAFSQSDFQKGSELNKQIYKQDMHILHNYEKYFKISKIAGKVSPKCRLEILLESFIFLSKLFQSNSEFLVFF